MERGEVLDHELVDHVALGWQGAEGVGQTVRIEVELIGREGEEGCRHGRCAKGGESGREAKTKRSGGTNTSFDSKYEYRFQLLFIRDNSGPGPRNT